MNKSFGPGGGRDLLIITPPRRAPRVCKQRRAATQTVPPAAVACELLLRQGCVNLGVCTGRGLGSASGTAETEACEMPVYLGTR